MLVRFCEVAQHDKMTDREIFDGRLFSFSFSSSSSSLLRLLGVKDPK